MLFFGEVQLSDHLVECPVVPAQHISSLWEIFIQCRGPHPKGVDNVGGRTMMLQQNGNASLLYLIDTILTGGMFVLSTYKAGTGL